MPDPGGASMVVVVLVEDREVAVHDAVADADHLWLAPQDLAAATGWALQPRGLCRGEACVQLPVDGSWTDAAGRVDLAAFAAHLRRPLVGDAEHGVWAIGASVDDRLALLDTAQAPDFTLPDLDGTLHALSDFRGSKVLLTSWGSYCGCREDLPVWQILYDELSDQGLEIVAVALDAGGRDAVAPAITARDMAAVPSAMGTAMGWSEELWSRRRAPTFTCLIDEGHLLAELLGLRNVPMAVWIDEDGRIVRPAEAAGMSDMHQQVDTASLSLPEGDVRRVQTNRRVYWDAIRDWVAKGAESVHALSPEAVRTARRTPGEADIRAAAHARVAQWLARAGRHEAARGHLREAGRLCPQTWSYRRQSMVMTAERIGNYNNGPDFWEAILGLGETPFHEDVDMPGWQPTPRLPARSA